MSRVTLCMLAFAAAAMVVPALDDEDDLTSMIALKHNMLHRSASGVKPLLTELTHASDFWPFTRSKSSNSDDEYGSNNSNDEFGSNNSDDEYGSNNSDDEYGSKRAGGNEHRRRGYIMWSDLWPFKRSKRSNSDDEYGSNNSDDEYGSKSADGNEHGGRAGSVEGDANDTRDVAAPNDTTYLAGANDSNHVNDSNGSTYLSGSDDSDGVDPMNVAGSSINKENASAIDIGNLSDAYDPGNGSDSNEFEALDDVESNESSWARFEAASNWVRLDGRAGYVAITEGNDVEVEIGSVGLGDCGRRCDANPLCHSFAYCEAHYGCYLKDLELHGGEAVRYVGSGCNTMYPSTATMTKGNDPTVADGILDRCFNCEFIDLGAGAFPAAGELRNVSYHVARANQGGQKFQVYRPVINGVLASGLPASFNNTYQLVAETESIPSPQAGITLTHEFTSVVQFRAGDFIGWAHTGQGTFPFTNGTGSVLYTLGIEGLGSEADFSAPLTRVYAYEVEVAYV